MSARVPSPGTYLRCDVGSALVVQPGTSKQAGLNGLFEAEIGGPILPAHHPAVAAALLDVRMETWHSTTKRWREGEGHEEWDEYWSPNGDGARSITVAYFPDHLDTLSAETRADLTDLSHV